MNPVDGYAQAVIDGVVPAGKYHRLACVRHQRDRSREGMPGFPYRFDLAKAERFFRFAGQLKHYKGEWAGQAIVLQPYQVFRLGSIFGWIRADGSGLRRFRTAYNEIPRKNGKSLEAAVVALYTTFFDGEPGAEGYTIATKRDQAKLVFNDAKKLVQSSGLKTKIVTQVANLHIDATACKLEPLGADADSTDGLNPHFIGVDEFHAHKDRALIDVMETATGARRQPLNFQITTAGDDPVSPCGDQHDYATKILDGALTDETFFAFIASADPEDDWQDERTWQKANPNWSVSIKPDDMRALATKAKGIPAAAATFKQKRLNIWVNSYAPCLSMEGWRKGQTEWRAEDLRGESCFIGVDLASKLDLMALVAVFPPRNARLSWRWLTYAWTPEATVIDRAHRDRAPYDVWRQQGWLRTTDGETLDQNVIRQVLKTLREQFTIDTIGFDPWHAGKLIDDLKAQDGFAVEQIVAISQTYKMMSSACLTVQAEVQAGRVDARGCPVTTWAASNIAGEQDGKDNLMFSKKRSRGRIDPIIAGTIGTAVALLKSAVVQPEYRLVILGRR